MTRLDFSKLPVNSLVGARWQVFRDTCKAADIDRRYRKKYFLTAFICRILSFLIPLDTLFKVKTVQKRELKLQPPIFIIGHWRSGTTYLHNIMTKDERFGYTTTYQTLFPNLMFGMKQIIKPVIGALMPKRRPTDNMELGTDLPQEEEFALSNMISNSYYRFWVFPRKTMEYVSSSLTQVEATRKERDDFATAMLQIEKSALECSGKECYLSKNPPHTARVKELSKIFPNARFIYIMRNPYEVFESTCSFFKNVLPSLTFQEISQREIEENILRVYPIMYHKYKEDIKEIDCSKKIEITFEDLEQDPLRVVERIYRHFEIDGFESVASDMKRYIDSQKEHKRNNYHFTSQTIERVNDRWGETLREWNYKILKE